MNTQTFSFTLCLTKTPLRLYFWKALRPTNLLKVVTSLFKKKLPHGLLEGSHRACFQWMIYAFENKQDALSGLVPQKPRASIKASREILLILELRVD